MNNIKKGIKSVLDISKHLWGIVLNDKQAFHFEEKEIASLIQAENSK